MTIPLELDDAAKIDGANPLQVYFTSYCRRHGLRWYRWASSIFSMHGMILRTTYIPAQPRNWTLAVGCQTFDALYTVNTHLIMAVSVLMIIPPILLFFFSQKIFTQGIVFTGIKG